MAAKIILFVFGCVFWGSLFSVISLCCENQRILFMFSFYDGGKNHFIYFGCFFGGSLFFSHFSALWESTYLVYVFILWWRQKLFYLFLAAFLSGKRKRIFLIFQSFLCVELNWIFILWWLKGFWFYNKMAIFFVSEQWNRTAAGAVDHDALSEGPGICHLLHIHGTFQRELPHPVFFFARLCGTTVELVKARGRLSPLVPRHCQFRRTTSRWRDWRSPTTSTIPRLFGVDCVGGSFRGRHGIFWKLFSGTFARSRMFWPISESFLQFCS